MRGVLQIVSTLALGLALGLSLPVRSSVVQKETPEPPTDMERPLPPCPDPEPSDPLASHIEAWLGQWQQFVETWGTPTAIPSDWDSSAEEEKIRERLGVLPLDLLEVDCDLHPCVAIVAQIGEIDLDTLREAAHAGPKDIRIGEVWSETVTAEVGEVIFVESDLTELERKWSFRLAKRLGTLLEPQFTELLEE